MIRFIPALLLVATLVSWSTDADAAPSVACVKAKTAATALVAGPIIPKKGMMGAIAKAFLRNQTEKAITTACLAVAEAEVEAHRALTEELDRIEGMTPETTSVSCEGGFVLAQAVTGLWAAAGLVMPLPPLLVGKASFQMAETNCFLQEVNVAGL